MIVTANPFIRLYEAPIESLTLAAYLLILLAALVGTWWLLTRNVLELIDQATSETWAKNTPLYPPFRFIWRLAAVPVIVAIDLFLIAAFLYFVTP